MTIRNAVHGDSGRIAEIYAHYVLDTAISFELVPPDADEIGRRMAAFSPYPYIVAEENGIVIGYAYAHPLSERPAYRRSAEVTIYLDSAMQGKGIGKALYAELEKQLKSIDVHNLYAIVTYPGWGSVEFHQKMGYSICGRLTDCGEKLGQLQSVVYMEKRI